MAPVLFPVTLRWRAQIGAIGEIIIGERIDDEVHGVDGRSARAAEIVRRHRVKRPRSSAGLATEPV